MLKIKSMIAAFAIAMTTSGAALAQDAVQETDTEARIEAFSDAIFFREGVKEKALGLVDEGDEMARSLIENGGVEYPGQAVMVENEIYYIFDTCYPRMCSDQALRMIITPSGDIFIKNEKKDRSHIRGTGEVTPKITEIMDHWG